MALLQKLRGTTRNLPLTNIIFKQCFHCTNYLYKKGDNVKQQLICQYQDEKPRRHRKVSVIGASGQTGVAMSYTLLLGNYCDEVVMYDRKQTIVKLNAECLDFMHGSSIRKIPKFRICVDMKNTKDSDLIIFNAGKPRKPTQTRLDVCQDNIDIMKEIVPGLAEYSPNSVLLVVANPTDVMTYTAWKYSCFEKHRVIGTGTELDSARFRFHIANRLGVNPFNVGGWVIGEHGDSSVPAWSTVHVGACRLRDIDPCIGTPGDKNCWKDLHVQTMKDGGQLVAQKGCTQYAIAQTADVIARAVLSNARTVHCVSTQLTGMYDIDTEAFLSLPSIIGNRGIYQVLQPALEEDEVENLQKSAALLDKVIKSMKF